MRTCQNCTFYEPDRGIHCFNGWSSDGSRGWCQLNRPLVKVRKDEKCVDHMTEDEFNRPVEDLGVKSRAEKWDKGIDVTLPSIIEDLIGDGRVSEFWEKALGKEYSSESCPSINSLRRFALLVFWEYFRNHGITCRKVRVCEEVGNG